MDWNVECQVIAGMCPPSIQEPNTEGLCRKVAIEDVYSTKRNRVEFGNKVSRGAWDW